MARTHRLTVLLIVFFVFMSTWVFLVYAWPVVWLLLWLSPWWSVRDKLLGTLIPVEEGVALFGGLWVLGSRSGEPTPSIPVAILVAIAMASLVAVAIATSVRLACSAS